MSAFRSIRNGSCEIEQTAQSAMMENARPGLTPFLEWLLVGPDRLQRCGAGRPSVLHGTEGLTDPDETPEVPAEPVSTAGDLWLLGKHRVRRQHGGGGREAGARQRPPAFDGDGSALRCGIRSGWTGHLFQGHFSSVILDEERLMLAARYVALNPARARLVQGPQDWAWSSLRAHLAGRDDGLVTVAPLLKQLRPHHRTRRHRAGGDRDDTPARRGSDRPAARLGWVRHPTRTPPAAPPAVAGMSGACVKVGGNCAGSGSNGKPTQGGVSGNSQCSRRGMDMKVSASIPRFLDANALRDDPLSLLRAAHAAAGDIVMIAENRAAFSRASDCAAVVAVFGPAGVQQVLSDADLFDTAVSVGERFSLPPSLNRPQCGPLQHEGNGTQGAATITARDDRHRMHPRRWRRCRRGLAAFHRRSKDSRRGSVAKRNAPTRAAHLDASHVR